MLFGPPYRDSFCRSASACLLFLLCAFPGAAAAKSLAAQSAASKSEASTPEPLLQADHLSYDENTNTVTATGDVEVAYQDQILRADKVTYNKETNVVKATGHVVMTQSSGEILHAKEIEITADMKESVIGSVGIYFPDKSRLAANDAQRFEGRYLVTSHGVYSACDLCAADPSKPPLWQIKGVRVTHDSEEKKVIYRDAVVEFAGLPVFYTPYLSHPDPSVKRKQGFLTPNAGHSATLGYMSQVPYYFDLAPNSDLILTPTFSQEDKLQVAMDWRHRFANGSMRWTGSVARTDFINEDGYDKGQQWRGNLVGTTQFDLNEEWRTGTQINFTSDKSYLARYKIGSSDVLVNRAYAERFSGRDYAVGSMYYFQDTRPGNQLKEPFVAPEMRYSAFGEPNETLGGRWAFNSGLLVTTRERNVPLSQQGPNTRRLSLDTGWERRFVSSTGFLTDVAATARADTYWADNVPDPNDSLGTNFSNVRRVRPFAQTDITLRYPLGRRGEGYQQILEPISLVSIAPRQSWKTVLPNEDSQDVELDETNLFAPNRFTGIDKLEGGTRVAYGVRHALIGDGGERIEMLGGQVYRTRPDKNFAEVSGLQERFSDYVGHLTFAPANWLTSSYGFKLDKDDLSLTRQIFSASAGAPIFRPNVRYLSSRLADATTGEISRIEEGSFGISSSFLKYWSVSASNSYAFKPAPGPRSTSVGIGYHDECFEASLTGDRDYTVRTDVNSGTTVMFRFFLKNIGGWQSSKISTGTM